MGRLCSAEIQLNAQSQVHLNYCHNYYISVNVSAHEAIAYSEACVCFAKMKLSFVCASTVSLTVTLILGGICFPCKFLVFVLLRMSTMI